MAAISNDLNERVQLIIEPWMKSVMQNLKNSKTNLLKPHSLEERRELKAEIETLDCVLDLLTGSKSSDLDGSRKIRNQSISLRLLLIEAEFKEQETAARLRAENKISSELRKQLELHRIKQKEMNNEIQNLRSKLKEAESSLKQMQGKNNLTAKMEEAQEEMKQASSQIFPNQSRFLHKKITNEKLTPIIVLSEQQDEAAEPKETILVPNCEEIVDLNIGDLQLVDVEDEVPVADNKEKSATVSQTSQSQVMEPEVTNSEEVVHHNIEDLQSVDVEDEVLVVDIKEKTLTLPQTSQDRVTESEEKAVVRIHVEVHLNIKELQSVHVEDKVPVVGNEEKTVTIFLAQPGQVTERTNRCSKTLSAPETIQSKEAPQELEKIEKEKQKRRKKSKWKKRLLQILTFGCIRLEDEEDDRSFSMSSHCWR